jgi:hypothetical protein
LTLSPGTYVGGIAISGEGPVTLTPGVYVMEGGGFTVTGQGSVSGSGVVIINVPGGPTDTISLTGQGSVNLSAPTGGSFKGVVLFQDPASSNLVSFTSKGVVVLDGVVYVPDAKVSITGNVTINHGPGTASLPPILGALIASDLEVDGNGALTIDPDNPPGGAAAQPGGRRGSKQANDVLLPQESLLLSGGLHVDGTNHSLVPLTRSAATTTVPNQPALDQVFSSNSGSTAIVLSDETKGVQLDRSIASWVDPLTEQLVYKLVSSLVQLA